jgi:adenylate kinase
VKECSGEIGFLMILIMLGAPGTGKGTQGKLISAFFKIPNISTGEMLRTAIENKTPLGKRAKSFMDKGELLPDAVMIGLINERLRQNDCSKGFILDGFPRTVKQAEALDDLLQSHGLKLDYTIGLDLASEKIIERLTSRRLCQVCGKDYNTITDPPPGNNKCAVCGGEIIQRFDDTAETVSKRLLVYAEKTQPLITYYSEQGKFKLFDADGTVEEINKKILKFLSKDK